MSEHQSLVYIITFVFIGIAVFVGLELFDSYRISANKEAIVNTMNVIAEDVIHYRARPSSMGGGGGENMNYKIPGLLSSNEDGSFTASAESSMTVIVGTSTKGYGQVQAMISPDGNLLNFHLLRSI